MSRDIKIGIALFVGTLIAYFLIKQKQKKELAIIAEEQKKRPGIFDFLTPEEQKQRPGINN